MILTRNSNSNSDVIVMVIVILVIAVGRQRLKIIKQEAHLVWKKINTTQMQRNFKQKIFH